MSRNISRLADEYTRKSLKGRITAEAVENAIEQQGYTTVYFNNAENNEDVDTLGRLLGVSELLRSSRGFTYADQNSRVVFINEDLSDNEKLYVLLHEQGHIICGHLGAKPVIGADVMEEHEANEFVHYVMKPTALGMISRHRKPVIISASLIAAACIAAVAGVNIAKQQTYYGEYYITETGQKYHREECMFIKDRTSIHRLTEEDFYSGEYEPCKACLPDDSEE